MTEMRWQQSDWADSVMCLMPFEYRSKLSSEHKQRDTLWSCDSEADHHPVITLLWSVAEKQTEDLARQTQIIVPNNFSNVAIFGKIILLFQ